MSPNLSFRRTVGIVKKESEAKKVEKSNTLPGQTKTNCAKGTCHNEKERSKRQHIRTRGRKNRVTGVCGQKRNGERKRKGKKPNTHRRRKRSQTPASHVQARTKEKNENTKRLRKKKKRKKPSALLNSTKKKTKNGTSPCYELVAGKPGASPKRNQKTWRKKPERSSQPQPNHKGGGELGPNPARRSRKKNTD